MMTKLPRAYPHGCSYGFILSARSMAQHGRRGLIARHSHRRRARPCRSAVIGGLVPRPGSGRNRSSTFWIGQSLIGRWRAS